MGSADCHGWGTLSVALGKQSAPSFSRLQKRYPQRCMRTHKMVVRAPPLEVSQQLWSMLGRGPGTSCERCHSMTDGQWSPLNESGVESSRETHPLQGACESCLCPQAHHRRDSRQFASPVAFLHLTIDQLGRHLPLEDFPASATYLEPVSKMSCQSIEVQV